MWTASLLRSGIALLAGLAVSLGSFGGPTKLVDQPLPAGAEHTFTFRTTSDSDLAGWALGRFDRAGLELPPLAVAFHDDREPCGGHFGLYRTGNPARVDICGFNWDRFAVTAKKTLLHELGHAWTQHNLRDSERGSFLALRHLDTWGNDEFPWEEQGSEQAAEIIAWALLDQEIQPAKFGEASREALTRAYLQLTGSLPLERVP
jgi:hypothetical protein